MNAGHCNESLICYAKVFTQYQLMQKVVVSSNILNNDENHFYNANFDK